MTRMPAIQSHVLFSILNTPFHDIKVKTALRIVQTAAPTRIRADIAQWPSEVTWEIATPRFQV